MPDFDPRDHTIWAECEACEQTANVTHIDDQWRCDHCLMEEEA